MQNINSSTIGAFLIAKGWTVGHVGERFIQFDAPELKGTQFPPMIPVPVDNARGSDFYETSMNTVLHSISLIYGRSKSFYQAIFSRSLPAINLDVVQQEKVELGAVELKMAE